MHRRIWLRGLPAVLIGLLWPRPAGSDRVPFLDSSPGEIIIAIRAADHQWYGRAIPADMPGPEQSQIFWSLCQAAHVKLKFPHA
jgi:hypothetical protein